jgi:phage terminase large subunit
MVKRHSDKWDALANDTRFFVLTGGRGSGKSYEVGKFTSLLSFQKGHKILFTRQTMTSAHLSIIPEFQEKIDIMNLNNRFDVNKAEITNKESGSEIIFRGIKSSSGDQTANLKSLQGVTTWILDEAEELTDEKTFDKINLSIRQKGIQNRVILILNPATKEHWIYKRFFESAGVETGFNGIKGNTTYIHTTYLDNIQNLDQSFIDEVLNIEASNPTKYKHVILGGWLDKSEGAVFTNWKLGKFEEVAQSIYGQDYGFSIDPTTLIQTSIDKTNKRIYVKELLYQTKLTTTEISIINARYCDNRLIVADSAEPRLIHELRSRGNNVRETIKGPGSVSAGIALMQDYELIIDNDSINIIKELNNYSWSDKKSNTAIDAFNHAIDAMRYAIYFQLAKPNAGKYNIG